jgi:hypothetical protein
MNQRRLRGYRRLVWVCCPDFSETLWSEVTSTEMPLKMETIVSPKRRDNSSTPGGDILEDVVNPGFIIIMYHLELQVPMK